VHEGLNRCLAYTTEIHLRLSFHVEGHGVAIYVPLWFGHAPDSTHNPQISCINETPTHRIGIIIVGNVQVRSNCFSFKLYCVHEIMLNCSDFLFEYNSRTPHAPCDLNASLIFSFQYICIVSTPFRSIAKMLSCSHYVLFRNYVDLQAAHTLYISPLIDKCA
jgi:hypothetical protein